MATRHPGLVLLDRDGVLNSVVVDPEHGTIDSPLHPDQVRIYEWVPEALQRITALGYGLAIVTNQPAAAKGKTTMANLEAVHAQVLKGIRVPVLSSHLCFHRAEDGCLCRKPKVGMLREAFDCNPGYDASLSWMAGDGVTDVQAGVALGLKTAFFGPKKCDSCKVLDEMSLKPTFWGKNLLEGFAQHLEKHP